MMALIRLIRIALKAIARNKFRTFLTMLGIIIGVGSVIAMLAIGQGSKKSIQDEISAMGSNMVFVRPGADTHGPARGASGSNQTLTFDDIDAIRSQAENVSAVSPDVGCGGQVIYGASNWNTHMHGVSPEYLKIRKLSISTGESFADKDSKSAAKVCLLGQTVVENLFEDGEDPLGKMIRFKKVPFKIVGVLEEKGENTFGQDQDDIILAPYTTVMKRLLATTYLGGIYTSATSEETAADAEEEIEQILRVTHKLTDAQENDFHVRSQQELLTTFSSTTDLLTVLLASIASISLLVGGIGIMNIMYVSVTERTREIGLRMAVGARGLDIMFQFLIEAVIISVTGGLVGLALGLVASFAIATFAGWPTVVTAYSVILSFAVCAVTGMFFGWYPAVKASRLDPIEALRYE